MAHVYYELLWSNSKEQGRCSRTPTFEYTAIYWKNLTSLPVIKSKQLGELLGGLGKGEEAIKLNRPPKEKAGSLYFVTKTKNTAAYRMSKYCKKGYADIH